MADCFDGCSDGMDVRVVQQGRGWGVKTGFGFAILAGFFAALASVFAKISFSNVIIGSIVCGQHTSLNGPNLTSTSTGKELFHPHSVIKCEIVVITLRIFGAIMIFVCNAVMFRSFSKSLLLCNSTAEATITNTAANFCFSAIAGWLIFGESFSSTWCFGTTLIIIGLAIIYKSREGSVEESKKLS